jgi:dihydrofolate synthase/folylpolyglutamate synthase
LFPKNAKYYFCKPNLPRGLSAELLQDKAANFGLQGEVFDSVSSAYIAALDAAQDADFIYIGGSTFVVAEIV